MKERTPQEVRELTERDYQRWMGLDAESARKLALADLNYVEAAKRHGEISESVPKPLPAQPNHRQSESVRKAEQDNGVRIVDNPGEMEFERFSLLHADPTTVDEAWALCMGRIQRIVEGADAVAKSYYAATRGCTCPDLAYKVIETLAFFKLRHRSGSRRLVFGAGHSGASDHNPFRNPHTGQTLSDIDACRKLRRIFEDIADQSSKQLGPWRIPK